MNNTPTSGTNSRLPSISILGCGWYGLALAKELERRGYSVKGSTTSADKKELLQQAGIIPFQFRFPLDIRDDEKVGDFFNSDILFIAIPPKRKEGKSDEYVEKVGAIVQSASLGAVKHVILISSTGVYPNAKRSFDERDVPVPDNDFSNALWTAEQRIRDQKTFTATVIRFGGLVGEDRNPGRFFTGKKSIPNGLAPVNLIHQKDCVGISIAILEKEKFGHTFNACSPQHPSRQDYYTLSARRSGLPLPEFLPELLDWKIINSIRVPDYLFYSFKESLA